jgi:N-acetylmuramoyl-L-alanine amidase
MIFTIPAGSRLRPVLAAIILLTTVPFSLAATPQRGISRLDPFERAARLREALEGRPEQQRTRLQYDRVLDAYRAIYHSDPASPKADASIAAVADLLAEEGRIFQDRKALHDAIGQYEFLRRQYPASRYRFSALLTEGEIDQRDLGDLQQASAVYQTFLRLYPQNALAEEARLELKTIRREQATLRQPSRSRPPTRASGHRDTILTAAMQSQQQPAHSPSPRTILPPQTPGRLSANSSAPSEDAEGDPAPLVPSTEAPLSRSAQAGVSRSGGTVAPSPVSDDLEMNAPPPPSRGGLPLITGIRHWSTPVYTRVAIDLQQEVRFQAVRVPGPDRIFFDLYGTRLSPELVGRSVEVTDDGFLSRIRAAQSASNITRIVLDVNNVSDYAAFFLPNPPRLIIDVHGGRPPAPPVQVATNPQRPAAAPHPSAPYIATETPAPARPAPAAAPRSSTSSTLTEQDISSSLADVASLSNQPNQVPATRHPTTAPVAASVAGTTPAPQPSSVARTATRIARPAPQLHASDDVPPAEAGVTGVPANLPSGQHMPNSMVRALGLKINRIVIDAGHGGHDSGTLGPGGLQEKDVVLDVALRLGRLLRQRLGADVIYTRSDDTFIPLETRTAIANQAQADLFISVHANSSHDADARGVETYYLNFTSSADALEVAARENAVSDQSIHQLSDLVKKIALQDKINESREFASDVEDSLYSGLEQGNPGLRDRGVKKAPFVVLIGANMPSILAEISFLTNPEDAQELRQSQYRERIAESLYRGVSRYVSSLNGVHVAQAASPRPVSTE